MKVVYVEKDRLFPSFGRVYPRRQIAYVRKDLPESVQLFVKEHELYHLRDEAKNWVWREIKANCSAFLIHPWGGLCCFFMSVFSLARLKMYWNRFREGK